MNAAEFAQLVPRAKRRADGVWWDGRCRAHEDQRSSLSFRDGDRAVIVKCHAGCVVERIAAAFGVEVGMLFYPNVNGHPAPAAKPHIVATYDYRDERGAVLYQVCRFEPKDFRMRRPEGDGWSWTLNGTRRVVYRLDELAEASRVYHVEGEKDADRLVSLALRATTTPGGAGNFREDYADQLKAAGLAEVIVLPDRDEAGDRYAADVARTCLARGLRVKVIALPGLTWQAKGGPDVSDWLDAGHARADLEASVDATPWLTDASAAPVTEDGLALMPLGDLLGEPDIGTRWLVDQRLPAAGLGLLAGKPKGGKSTLARCLALHVARGEPWLGFNTTRGDVIYLALEEKRQEVKDHFRLLGATAADSVYLRFAAVPQDALVRLRLEAERRRPVLVIIDPLFKFVRVAAELGNDYAAMTTLLEPLLTLARETEAHVLAVHHLGKGERGDGDAILGSTAIFAAVDTALLLKRSERYRTLSSIQRYGTDLDEITVTLDPLTLDILAGPPRAQAELADAGGLLLAFVKRASDPVTEAEFDGAIECRRQVWKKALRELVGTGKLIRTGRGGKGDPFKYCGSLVVPGTTEPEGLFRA